MSLFRPYQYKPRPDYLPNAPTKKAFFRFLEIYFRKFWRFFSVNFWYFLVTLPMLLVVFYTVNGAFADRLAEDSVLLAGVGFIASFFSFVPKFLYTPLVIISVLMYGPLTMGMTYIFRNFAREEHAWMSDLWSRAWSNAKQGLIFGFLDILLTSLFVFGIFGNVSVVGKNAGYSMSVILSVVCALALIIWLFMRHYTYMMAVSVNLSVIRILKNAWLFVVLGFGRNLIAGLVTLACMAFSFLLAPLFTIITVPFLYYSFTWFCTCFTCYPIVNKYIIVPAMDADAASRTDSQTETLPETDPEAPELQTEETEETGGIDQ